MNIKRIILSALLAVGALSASAQETKTVEVFKPHWYIQAQAGGQYTLGEAKFKDLLSGNAQIAAGYQFTSVWGLRLAINAWQSKGASTYTNPVFNGDKKWKWNYVAPNLDVTCDLTNLFGGYKYNRLVNVGIFAGIGANTGWNNHEAREIHNAYAGAISTYPDAPEVMEYYWSSHSRQWAIQGHFGANVDFRVCDRVKLGIEVASNVLTDHYNSKKAGNADWYFNALAGVKVNLGKTHKTKTVEKTCCKPQVVEKVVEKIIEKPVEKIVYKEKEPEKIEPLRRDIFFNICGSTVSSTEMTKVEDIVAYLKKYPQATVTITGYADKGTGSAKGNKVYAEKRANMVANLLTKTYGIAANRITVESKGDTVQPYAENELNRVSICIAKP